MFQNKIKQGLWSWLMDDMSLYFENKTQIHVETYEHTYERYLYGCTWKLSKVYDVFNAITKAIANAIV